MFVIRSIVNDKYINANGDLVDTIEEAYDFETKEIAIKYAIHVHILDPEYIELNG